MMNAPTAHEGLQNTPICKGKVNQDNRYHELRTWIANGSATLSACLRFILVTDIQLVSGVGVVMLNGRATNDSGG